MRLPGPLHRFVMLLTPRQWAWIAMLFAALSVLSLAGCASPRSVLPLLPVNDPGRVLDLPSEGPCFFAGSIDWPCPPRS